MDFNALQRDLQEAASASHHGGGHHRQNCGGAGSSSAGGGGSSSSGVSNGGNIQDVYEFLGELGHGAYGSVMKARKRPHRIGSNANRRTSAQQSSSTAVPPTTGSIASSSSAVASSTASSVSASTSSSLPNETLYAVKIIDKRKAGSKGLSEVMGEVETMSLLNHPNIVHLEETFQDDHYLWIVMELMPGGELHKVLKRVGSFPEATSRQLIIQVLLAVEYIHQRGIVHRDLKPANMLLRDELDWQIKIADFGFAVMVGADSFLTSYCGTGAYMAPEIVLDLNYGKPVDIWACGVILYLLIAGDYPFAATPQQDLPASIVANQWQQHMHPKIAEASPGCRDFLSKLLTTDAKQRITAKEALKHTWIQTSLQGLSHRLEAAAAAATGGGGAASAAAAAARRLPPRSRFRAWTSVVLAAHRLVFWRRLRVLRNNYADVPLLKNFRFLVSGKYDPPRGVMNAAGVLGRNPRAIAMFLLPMVEASSSIDTLDLSDNSIDSVDLVQAIVKSVMSHPSLTTIVLERNPIPALAGRGLVRLARATSNRLRVIRLTGTLVGPDVLQQVAVALKEKKPSGEGSMSIGGGNSGTGGTAHSNGNGSGGPSPFPPSTSGSGPYSPPLSQQHHGGANAVSPIPPPSAGTAPHVRQAVVAASTSSASYSGPSGIPHSPNGGSGAVSHRGSMVGSGGLPSRSGSTGGQRIVSPTAPFPVQPRHSTSSQQSYQSHAPPRTASTTALRGTYASSTSAGSGPPLHTSSNHNNNGGGGGGLGTASAPSSSRHAAAGSGGPSTPSSSAASGGRLPPLPSSATSAHPHPNGSALLLKRR